ncbi:MAG: AbrB/MazE/SpoVT family DNA-binding domain-containing protein [Sphingobium sp.]
MNVRSGKLVSGGRLQVPANIRRQLGLTDGAAVMMRVVNGELHVRPLRDAVAKVQQRLRAHISPGPPLSDELIADRRSARDD